MQNDVLKISNNYHSLEMNITNAYVKNNKAWEYIELHIYDEIWDLHEDIVINDFTSRYFILLRQEKVIFIFCKW